METNKSYIMDSTEKVTELSQHGIYFARGGAIELLSFPPLEQVLLNDWQEENGLEIDTKSIIHTCPYIQLRFVIRGETREQFADRLAFFRQLLDSYYLRLFPASFGNWDFNIDNISFEGYKQLGRPLYLKGTKVAEVAVRCRLKEGVPKPEASTPTQLPPSRITIGNTDLAEMGVQVEEVYSSLLEPNAFKERTFKEKSKEIALNCISIAPTYEGLMVNLKNLWKHLKYKQLYLSYGAGKVRCYYTSMTNLRELLLTNKKGIAFTLNFKTT